MEKTFEIKTNDVTIVGKAKNTIDFLEELLKGVTVVKQETK